MSMTNEQLQSVVEAGWDERDELKPGVCDPELREAVDEILTRLEEGRLRVAEPGGSGWQVNAWVKQAILLHFRISWNKVMHGSIRNYFDKVELRFRDASDAVEDCGARVVPPATVRQGAHIGRDVVLMPSYVNIGAWVGPGSMIDTWATVGSCAQIGAGVHISGGAGIGGVLEPL
ncbi:MAG: 2,3,4,5-tetrahydropyridine-2,6-dicarboxylate N-succinyltransferase, partial [Wenzhouxiangellaceae bacterium]